MSGLHLRQLGSSDPRVAALLLHGGSEHNLEPMPSLGLAYLRMVPFARDLARLDGVAVFQLRNRVRGWNEPDLDPVRDARWAIGEIRTRFPGVPIVLIGHSMGGRVAFRAAGDPAVVAVCALAPWCEPADPVDQLAGRAVFAAHGKLDRVTDPRATRDYTRRAQAVAKQVAVRWVDGETHSMMCRPRLWNDLVRQFVTRQLAHSGSA